MKFQALPLILTALVLPTFTQDEKPPKPEPEPSEFGVSLIKRGERPLRVGEKLAGETLLNTLDGHLVRFDELRGKTVVFVFWSSNCPYSQRYEDKFNRFAQDYARHGTIIVAVNSNVNEIGNREVNRAGMKPAAIEANYRARYPKLVKHKKERKLLFPIVIDTKNVLADELGAEKTPEAFVFDKVGRFRYSGAIDDDPKNEKPETRRSYLREAVNEVLAEKDVTTEKVAAKGRTIKRFVKAASAPKR